MLKNVLIKLVEKSTNQKTGAITQTYSSSNTCPTRCPFKNSGCYAASGPCGLVWKKMQKAVTPYELKELIQNSATTKLIRHNVAGDMAIEGTSELNYMLVSLLAKAFEGHQAYTYTHCEINERNSDIIKMAQEKGFVINYSCENIEQVKKAIAHGVPAVMTCEQFEGTHKTIEGIKFVKCPSYKDGVTCATCQMCSKVRNYVVVFEAHGTSKKKAINGGKLQKF